LSAFLTREPEDREELLELLHGAFEHKLLDADALSMIEGVLQVSEMTVRDIMIPRAQMDVVSIDDDPEDFLPLVLETKHSRFPVVGENKDDVVGILLAKELLNFYRTPDSFNLREMLRPAVFVPESKRLNVLLRDFRANRNHIAIVVDEYGGVSGLVTIEDVLEQIVGDIEDEYDFDEDEDNIIAEASGRYRVKAQTEIADFNAHFGADFADDEFDTVGGLVLQAFGRLPKRGETATIGDFLFRVVRADSRRLYTLQVEPLAPKVPADGEAPPPGEH
jgi:magnesium and cobalt transporter